MVQKDADILNCRMAEIVVDLTVADTAHLFQSFAQVSICESSRRRNDWKFLITDQRNEWIVDARIAG